MCVVDAISENHIEVKIFSLHSIGINTVVLFYYLFVPQNAHLTLDCFFSPAGCYLSSWQIDYTRLSSKQHWGWLSVYYDETRYLYIHPLPQLDLQHHYFYFVILVPGMLFLLGFSPQFFSSLRFFKRVFFRGYCWPHILNKLAHSRCFCALVQVFLCYNMYINKLLILIIILFNITIVIREQTKL